MERNDSLSKTRKDHLVDSASAWSHLRYAQLCSSDSPLNPFGINQTFGISWPPPRSYSCNFCRREFQSAQALGGHMNVHRRDRARLRLSSPVEDFHQYPVLSLSSNRSPSPRPNPNTSDASSTSPLLLTTNCSIARSFTPPPLLLSFCASAIDCRNEVKTADQNRQGAFRSRTMESKSKPESEASARVQEMSESYKCSNNDGEMDLLGGSNIDLELRLGWP